MSGAKLQRSLKGLAWLTVVGMAGAAAPAHAQLAASETAEATANILTPGSFFKVEDLDFGQIISSSTAGTVTVTNIGTRTRTGGVTLYGTDFHPAEFAGMTLGQRNGNRPVRIRIGANTIQLTGPTGSTAMTVHTFRPSANPNQPLTTNFRNYQINGISGGMFELKVGATLNVNANQAPGIYEGTWTIELQFQ